MLQIKKLEQKLPYLLGIFSTLQIISIMGITVYNWLLMISFIYMMYTKKLCIKKNDLVLIFLIMSFITIITGCCFNGLRVDYFKKNVISGIQLIMVLVIYILSYNNRSIFINKFIKGFNASCYIQLFWCYIQLIFFYLFNIDINNLIFNKILHMVSLENDMQNSRFICTGFHWHAANLIPILLWLCIFSKKIYIKFAVLVITIACDNTTILIGMSCYFIFTVLRFLKDIFQCNKVSKKIIILVIILAGFVVVFLEPVIEYSGFFLNGIIVRFKDAIDKNIIDNSSRTHFLYYFNLPFILKSEKLINIIWGYGIDCSGFIYSKLFNQYSNLTWILESDPVNIILSQGIAGFGILYSILIRNIIMLRKTNTKYFIFCSLLLIMGVTYNVQYNWIILLELMLWADMKYVFSEKSNLKVSKYSVKSFNIVECD